MRTILLSAIILFIADSVGAQPKPRALVQEWGYGDAFQGGEFHVLHVEKMPTDGRLAVPGLTRATSAAVRLAGEKSPVDHWLSVEYSPDGTQVHVVVPEDPILRKAFAESPRLYLLTPGKTQQRPSGEITFLAEGATVRGKSAKLEQTRGHNRIGFWTDEEDVVSWDYTATRPGNYEVIVNYAVDAGAEKAGSEIRISLGDQSVTATLANTKSWYRYTSVNAGKLRIPSTGKHSLSVTAAKKVGPAVMNLKAVMLRPASEGNPLTAQAEDGSITLHARDVTIVGVKAQWEPKPEKQTIGFWANENDNVIWQFEVKAPGTFEVEMLQGCGKGQGGSEVTVMIMSGIGTPALNKSLKFTVEDTGHWQNFVTRKIGKVTLWDPGIYELLVGPESKKGAAVMDLRQVRLIPVK